MDSSPRSKLTPLQGDLIREFFAHEQRFFLTGGAALAEFYLHHRKSDELELLALPDVPIDEGLNALREAALACGAVLESRHRWPEYFRLTATRGREQCIVNLAIDRDPTLDHERPQIGSIRLDSLRDIAARLLSTMTGRREARDLVDLKFILERISLEQALDDAEAKDTTFSRARLWYVLNQIELAPDTVLPDRVRADDLDAFRHDVIAMIDTNIRARTQLNT